MERIGYVVFGLGVFCLISVYFLNGYESIVRLSWFLLTVSGIIFFLKAFLERMKDRQTDRYNDISL